MLSFLLGVWVGGVIGIVMMCLLRISGDSADDISAHRD